MNNFEWKEHYWNKLLSKMTALRKNIHLVIHWMVYFFKNILLFYCHDTSNTITSFDTTITCPQS